MTSSSGAAEIVVAVAATLLLAGCVQERVIETQALVVAETTSCDVLYVSRDNEVNTYRVLVFEMDHPATDSSMCRACIADGSCPLTEMTCGCGPPIVPRTLELNRQLEGLRLRNLRPGREYCLGFVAAEVTRLPALTETQECDCAVVAARDAGAVPKVCGLSPFSGGVDENAPAFIIAAECPLDRPCPLAMVPPPE